MNKKVESLCLFIIQVCFCLILFVPLFVYKGIMYPYIFGKTISFQILVEIIFFVWLVLVIYDKKYRPNWKNLLLISLTIFIGILIFTMFTGVDSRSSFWSNQERMTGILAILHFWLWFLILGSIFKEWKDWRKLIWSSLICSFFIGFYGLGQKIGLQFLLRGDETRLFSTLGNPIFLGIYSMLHIFLGSLLLLKEGRKFLRVLIIIFILFNLLIMVFTATRGSMLAFIISLIIFIIYKIFTPPSSKIKSKFKKIFFILLFIFFIIYIFLQTNWAETLKARLPFYAYRLIDFQEFSRGFDQRIIVWKIGWQAFLEKPILGWGWGNFNIPFNKHYEPLMLNWGEASTWFDRSHNQLIDLLALTGAVGFLAYLFFYSSIFILIFKKIKEFKKQGVGDFRKKLILIILELIFLAYFIQNLTVFDTPAPLIIFYFSLGLVYFVTSTNFQIDLNIQIKKDQKKINQNIQGKNFPLPILILLIIIFLPVSLYQFNIKPLLASSQTIKCLSLIKIDPSQAISICKKAFDKNTFINPEARIMLVKNLVDNKIITDGLLRENEIKFIVSEMEKNIVEHPKDARYYLYLGQLYNAIAEQKKEYLIRGEEVLKEAEKLSPNRQQIYFALSQNELLSGDSLAAIQLAKKAVNLDLGVGESHKVLGLIYLQNQQLELGLKEIEEAEKTIDPYLYFSNALFIATSYFKVGNIERAISLSELARDRDPNNFQVYMQLAILYKENSEKQKAIESVKKAVELNPDLFSSAQDFIKSLK